LVIVYKILILLFKVLLFKVLFKILNIIFENMYKGCNIVNATINNLDITERVTYYYGENNDWQNSVWTNKDIFGEDSLKCNYYIEYISDKGIKYWIHDFINKLDDIFQPPDYKDEVIKDINYEFNNLLI